MVDEAPAAPDVELLCYHQTPPMLRVVNPRARSHRPFSGQKSFPQAVNLALARDGWVAGWAGFTYRFAVTERTKPTRVQNGRPFKAASDRRCIWIPDGRTWRLYDGVTNEWRDEVHLDGGHLLADTAHGLLVNEFDHTVKLFEGCDLTTEIRRWPMPHELITATASTLVWREADNRLRVEHLDTDTTVLITLPLWRLHDLAAGPASLSPDGQRLALTGDAIVGPIPFDIPRKERDKRKRQGSSLVIIDLIDGSVQQVGEYFERSAYRPVWSADGAWIFFGAPFEDVVYGVAVDHATPQLRTVDGLGRSVGMPLLDLANTRSAESSPID